MSVLRTSIWLVLSLVPALPLLAQSTESAPAPPAQSSAQAAPAEGSPQTGDEPPPPSLPPGAHRAHPRPALCWREAGIAPALVNQRWGIESTAKTKIGAVCTDSTLNPQQKSDQIRQINAQKEQEIAKIIPANQLTAFNACQAKQDQEAKRSAKTPKKELGPCGGVIPDQPGTAPHSHEHGVGSPAPQ
jgi:hypothetical protein